MACLYWIAGAQLLPLRGKDCSSLQMPFIKVKFPDFKSFSEADLSDIYTQEKLETALHLTASDFKSVLLLNKGNGNFSKSELPNVVQYGPTLSSKLLDVNNDGLQDIIGAGNIYETEPETVSYDASKGYVLINDGNGKFLESVNHDFLLNGNIKDIQVINIGNYRIQMHHCLFNTYKQSMKALVCLCGCEVSSASSLFAQVTRHQIA